MRDWIAQARSNEGVFRLATIGCAVLVVAMLVFTISVLQRDAAPGTLVSPPLIAGPEEFAEMERILRLVLSEASDRVTA